ncbi:NUDIX hydrolase [Brumimicrobium aurantiacum]|uniref:CoA pyrophosphatase n=1 Tax=Brumimicrobium aurantiacum TaxID=1737063 RepID=A0A3E1F0F2_9FLAO|nr:CoA pyrophosphatase [Brumimicrobium aurantiacum]RFC55280.1 CoA pyrophosphatase [Brumimicrobium aurantiacum]
MKLTIHEIRETLKLGLPGEEAHIPMSPTGRGRSSEAKRNAKNFKESAVALVLYESENKLNGILTERSPYKGLHSGEICLPGGKMETFDEDLKATALRECVEETGLKYEGFDFMGELTPVFIPVSNFSIQPFVFHYKSQPLFYPDTREVAEIFSFPIAQLLEKDVIKKTKIELSGRRFLDDIPYFDINNKVVWGATALILHEFKQLIGSPR